MPHKQKNPKRGSNVSQSSAKVKFSDSLLCAEKHSSSESTLLTSRESAREETAEDIYADVRFKQSLLLYKGIYVYPDWRHCTVQVKRHRPGEYREPDTFSLNLQLCETVHETLQVYSHSSSLLKKTVDALLPENSLPGWQTKRIKRETQAQEKSLKNYTTMQGYRCKRGEKMAQVLKKPLSTLMLSRHVLPPLANYRVDNVGARHYQKSHIQQFYLKDAFFKFPEKVGLFENEEITSLTRAKRKLCKQPEPVVRQALDGNHLVPENVLMDQPSLAGLYVTGNKGDMGKKPVTSDAGDENAGSKLKYSLNSTTTTFQSDDSLATSSCADLTDFDDEPPSSSIVYNKPCLQVQDKVYAWDEPCSEDMIEVGIVCREDEKATAQVRLSNLGSTVIRYGWYKEGRVDHFRKSRYALTCFIFDQSDGTLLPRETVYLNVEFKSPHPGRWCEYWLLSTTPRLGPGVGGDIVVSLWGMALQVDYHFKARQKLDKELNELALKRYTELQVQGLHKSLPVPSVTEHLLESSLSWERNLVTPDELLFEENNPGLYYHSKGILGLVEIRWMQTYGDALVDGGLVMLGPKLVETDESIRARSMSKAVPKPKSAFADAEPGNSVSSSLECQPCVKQDMKLEGSGTSLGSATTPSVSMLEPPDLIFYAQKINTAKKTDFDVNKMYCELRNMEDCPWKEAMLAKLNSSVSLMAFRSRLASDSKFKNLVFRGALMRFLDDVAHAEMSLRGRLNLLYFRKTPLGQIPDSFHHHDTVRLAGDLMELAEVPEEESDVLDPDNHYSITSVQSLNYYPSDSSLKVQVLNPSSVTIHNYVEHLPIIDDDPEGEKFDPWTQAEAIMQRKRQYMCQLYREVYVRLVAFVESLQPLINYDGIRLNPFLVDKDQETDVMLPRRG